MALLPEISPAGRPLLAAAVRIGEDVAGPAADAVDADGRFPHEAVDAMRSAGLLGAFVPASYGGGGCTITDLSLICTELGKHCGSAAMVFAMHQIQVACVVDHGQGIPYFDDLLTEIATSGRLIASATTELGVGGNVRSSLCAVERDGEKFSLRKQASVISYGAYVDDILVTARRDPDAANSDQVIVHVQRPNLTLDNQIDEWDTLGMRGTCSVGFELYATGTVDQILPLSYAEISAQTMLPVTHITWASMWLGIAEGAVHKARALVRSAARKQPGTLPPSARHLAVVVGQLDRLRGLVESSVREYERVRHDLAGASTMAFAIQMNNLKLCASVDVFAIVQASLEICGLAGYRNGTEYSLGRQLRDAKSASLMIHNDRILDHNAGLLCILKD
ncbi:MAG: putative acyl-CoA dehydrogenase [Ilumatobacteraceae bacterium]|nr:putative acyl-CoA dehydrogenase [Ilumatobacteraceae bacterium]